MEEKAYHKIMELAGRPEALEKSVGYLGECLRPFVKKQERVLICFPEGKAENLGTLLGKAVRLCGAVPVFWEADRLWKSLLRLAFSCKAAAIVGPPLIVLGLAKLARATGTPLFVKNVILSGYPCTDWMVDGVQKCLDCRVYGCYAPGGGPVVAGFSCEKTGDLHLREDVYSVRLVTPEGRAVPQGEVGEVVLWPKEDPSAALFTTELARMTEEKCPCGQTSPRLLDFQLGNWIDPQVRNLGQQLLSWYSVLDYRVKRTKSGLDLEIVAVPGEMLPELPSCARLKIRPWEPDTDFPFHLDSREEKPRIYCG